MMKSIFAFAALLTFSLPMAAQQVMSGQLLDSLSREPVAFAHVMNLSAHKLALSGSEGSFSIEAKPGDTLSFSSVGYLPLSMVVRPSDVFRQPVILLRVDITQLQEVTVSRIPEEALFKQRILNMHTTDTSFWYHGMAAPLPRHDFTLEESFMKNPVAALAHPLTYFYYRFSPQEKERRKHHKLVTSSYQRERVEQKFTREWVAEQTRLQGDTLTSFIAYCNFSVDYLDRTPLYMIREDMLVQLKQFLAVATESKNR